MFVSHSDILLVKLLKQELSLKISNLKGPLLVMKG